LRLRIHGFATSNFQDGIPSVLHTFRSLPSVVIVGPQRRVVPGVVASSRHGLPAAHPSDRPLGVSNPPDMIRTETHPSIVFAPHLWLTALAAVWLAADIAVSVSFAPVAVISRVQELCAQTKDLSSLGCAQVPVDGTGSGLVAQSKAAIALPAPPILEVLWWCGCTISWLSIVFAVLFRGKHHAFGLVIAHLLVFMSLALTWQGCAGIGQVAWIAARTAMTHAILSLAQQHMSPAPALMVARSL
jgi:hypothetical protein